MTRSLSLCRTPARVRPWASKIELQGLILHDTRSYTTHNNFGPNPPDRQAAATRPGLDAQRCVTSPDTLGDNTSKVVQVFRGLLQTSRQTYTQVRIT